MDTVRPTHRFRRAPRTSSTTATSCRSAPGRSTPAPPVALLLAWLDRGELPSGTAAPPADWDTGHFVGLEQLVRGRGGALVVVHDSYPTLGWDGHHLQPPEMIAAALLRGDGRRGGVLCVVGPDRAHDVAQLATALGLDTAMWHN